MNPVHDPLRHAAREHLRRHLVGLLDGVDMPETTRTTTVEALLQAGDAHCEDRTEIVNVDGLSQPALVHYAALTIRQPYPARTGSAEVAR